MTSANRDDRWEFQMLATDRQLAPVEQAVLMLLSAHHRVTGSPTAHRTTLEAYARRGVIESSAWAAEISSGSLRRALGEALRSLRSRGLVELADAGFGLTEAGRDAASDLQRDGELNEEAREARSSIEELRESWAS